MRSLDLKRWRRGVGAVALLGAGTLLGLSRAHERSIPSAPAAFVSSAVPIGIEEVSWDLPNLDHPRVDYFVGVFTGPRRAEFARYLERMGRYQPMISAKLAERGMPQDLIYLAMIESGFNPTAYSHAHASGLWQFIEGTARGYGLDINLAVDERRDPEKATDAALRYLRDLHEELGSWYLAAAAYNAGGGRVSRTLQKVTGAVRGGDESYYEIWSELPKETQDYVPMMVAAARIAKEPRRYGFDGVRPAQPYAAAQVTVEPATPLRAIAELAGTSVAEIRRLNPQLKLERTRSDGPSTIRVPAGAKDGFQERA